MLDPTFVRMAREAPYLRADEERDLIVQAQAGDTAARDKLVRAHLRLVIQLAQKRSGYRVPIEDMVQDGNVGLVGAIDRFDTAQPVRFATYAMWWIRAAMDEAAMRGHSIVRRNTTAAAKAMFFGIRSARARLEQDGVLAEGEIADRLAAQFDVGADTVRETLASLSQGDGTMDAPVSGSELRFVDTLVDQAPLPDDRAAASIDKPSVLATLQAALASLKERERIIVTARRCIDDGEGQTLEELSERFGVTRERVRQIEQRGLEKLRAFLEHAGVGPDALAA